MGRKAQISHRLLGLWYAQEEILIVSTTPDASVGSVEKLYSRMQVMGDSNGTGQQTEGGDEGPHVSGVR